MENNKNLWSLIKNKKINYDSFEKFLYSDSYLIACKNYDFSYNKSIYNEKWNIYEFNYCDSTSNIFFQSFLDGEVSQLQYFNAENQTIKFLERLFDQDSFAFYEFNSDTLDENYPAQESRKVLTNWNFLKANRGSFIELKEKSLFKDVLYLGIREIGLVYLIFVKSKIIAIPNECRCTILTEQPLSKKYFDSYEKSFLVIDKNSNSSNIG